MDTEAELLIARERIAQLEAEKAKLAQQALPGIGSTKGVTSLQLAFALIRAKHPSTREYSDAWCAEQAGYSSNGAKQAASKAKRNPVVKSLINRAKAKHVTDLGLTEARVIGDIMTVCDVAIGRQPVIKTVESDDGEVRDVMVTDYAPETVLRGNKLLAEYLGIVGGSKEEPVKVHEDWVHEMQKEPNGQGVQ